MSADIPRPAIRFTIRAGDTGHMHEFTATPIAPAAPDRLTDEQCDSLWYMANMRAASTALVVLAKVRREFGT